MKALSQTVGRICREAGLHGHRTNQSLRPTPATKLFPRETGERKVIGVSGHSHKAEQNHKRNGAKQRPALEIFSEGCPDKDAEFSQEEDGDESPPAKAPALAPTRD